jgi:hypothetical protein
MGVRLSNNLLVRVLASLLILRVIVHFALRAVRRQLAKASA